MCHCHLPASMPASAAVPVGQLNITQFLRQRPQKRVPSAEGVAHVDVSSDEGSNVPQSSPAAESLPTHTRRSSINNGDDVNGAPAPNFTRRRRINDDDDDDEAIAQPAAAVASHAQGVTRRRRINDDDDEAIAQPAVAVQSHARGAVSGSAGQPVAVTTVSDQRSGIRDAPSTLRDTGAHRSRAKASKVRSHLRYSNKLYCHVSRYARKPTSAALMRRSSMRMRCISISLYHCIM